MTLSSSNTLPPGSLQFTYKNSSAEEQNPATTIGRGPGIPLYTGTPTLPAVRGEAYSSSLPSRDETRPPGDHRSASQIYQDNPVLRVGVLSEEWDPSAKGKERKAKLIENLKRQVGDFTSANPDPQSRADAMYRLVRVINYIDNDPSIDRAKVNNKSGDGFLDGDGPNGSMPNSEVNRLEQFADHGYVALQASPRNMLHGRALGDHRTVEEITAGPLFKGLEVLSPEELKAFKRKVGGDWESDEIPADGRADIAANAERVLRLIDGKGGESSTASNGKIDGERRFTSLLPDYFQPANNSTLDGSEARRLWDFTQQGFSALNTN